MAGEAEVSFECAAVERALAQGKRLSNTMIQKLRATAQSVGLRIQGRAQERTPYQGGTLRRSATTTTRITGGMGLVTTVTFGGMAAAYAEVQHENPGLAHTPEAWRAKYGLPPPPDLPGHTGGHAQFLHGAPTSAWNASGQRWARMVTERASAAAAERELSR